MKHFIVAIPKDKYVYNWIASFESAEAAESYAIKFENAIVIYDVECLCKNKKGDEENGK